MTLRLWKDVIHGIVAMSFSKSGAWMLISNECHKKGIAVPTIDKIIEIDYASSKPIDEHNIL